MINFERKDLTNKQRATLEFIRSFIHEHQCPPTLKEIAAEAKITVTSAVQRVKQLAQKQYIKTAGGARNIRLIDEQNSFEPIATSDKSAPVDTTRLVSIPICGWVQAGTPFNADNVPQGFILLDRQLANPEACFALNVEGESMHNAGIEQNDIVVVRKQCLACSGQIVVASVDGALTIKRLYNDEKGVIELRPENDAMSPVSIYPETDLQILGVAILLIKTPLLDGRIIPL